MTFGILETMVMEPIDAMRAEHDPGHDEIDAQWITERIALGGWVDTAEK
ncbi:MAG: hypothetical protein JO249_13155, partial [Acidobacteria bacterium]|nr:hypothetical protein [Acidobacteriota bacterium]